MVVIQTERSLQFVFSILSRPPKTSDETCRLTIPDTLLYLHGSLRVWFHTDHDSGEVMRRDRREWSVQAILDAFCHGLPENSPLPVATYLHYSSSGGGSSGPSGPSASSSSGQGISSSGSRSNMKSPSKDSDKSTKAGNKRSGSSSNAGVKKDSRWVAEEYCRNFSEDAEPLCIDYFDRETLAAFLATRDNKHNVVVQKFVRGTSQNFTTLQMVWSPHRIVTMQRQNIHKMGDDHVALYDRCNTHENTAHLSREVCTTAKMSSRIEAECRKIVDHIAAVENRHVVRMVAFFAFNAQSVPVLLWASEVQITEQPITKEELAKQLTFQVKRRLCFISPPVVSSDVVLKSSVTGGGGGGGGSAVGSSSKQINVVNAAATTLVASAIVKKAKSSLEEQLELLDQTFTSAQETRPSRGHLAVSTRLELAKEFASLKFHAAKMQSELVTRRDNDRADKFGKKYVPGPFTSEEIAAERRRIGRPSSALSVASASNIHQQQQQDDVLSNASGNESHRSGSHASRPNSALSFLQDKEVAFCRGGGGGFYLRHAVAGGNDADALRRSSGQNGDLLSRRSSAALSLEQQLEDLQLNGSTLGRRRSSLGMDGSFSMMMNRRSSSVVAIQAVPVTDWSVAVARSIKYKERKRTGKSFALLKEQTEEEGVSTMRKKEEGTKQNQKKKNNTNDDDDDDDDDAIGKNDEDQTDGSGTDEDDVPTEVYFNTIRRNANDEVSNNRLVGQPVPAMSLRNGVEMHCLWEYFSHKIYHHYLLPILRSHFNALDFLEDFITELESSFYEQSAMRGHQGAVPLRPSLLLEILPIIATAAAQGGVPGKDDEEATMMLSLSSSAAGSLRSSPPASCFDRLLVGTRSSPIVSLCFLESIVKVLLPHERLPSAGGAMSSSSAAAAAAAAGRGGGSPTTGLKRRASTATFDLPLETSVIGSPSSAGASPNARPGMSPLTTDESNNNTAYPPSALQNIYPSREVQLPPPPLLLALLQGQPPKQQALLQPTPRSEPFETLFDPDPSSTGLAKIDERQVELGNVDRERLRKLIGGLRAVANAIESSAAFLKIEVLSRLYNTLRESYVAQMNRICSGGKRFRGSIPTAMSKPLQLPLAVVQRGGSRTNATKLTLIEGAFTHVLDVVRGELDSATREAQRLVDWPPATVYRPIPLCVEALSPQ